MRGRAPDRQESSRAATAGQSARTPSSERSHREETPSSESTVDVGTSQEELERFEDPDSSPIFPHAFVRPENQGPDLPPLLRLLSQTRVHSSFDSQGTQNSANSLNSQEPIRHGIRKILISLDVGDGNIKASWKHILRHDRERVLVDRLIHEKCRPVLWKNSRPCPA